MTPTDAAIAQAFRETNTGLDSALDFAGKVVRRARELDAKPEQVHTCSYYCDRKECLKAQRDELRDRLEGLDAEKGGEPPPNWCRTCGKHWSDPTAIFCSDGIHNPNKATPPAKAAEAAVSVDRLVPSNCRERLRLEGKPYPRSSCQACGKFSPKSSQCDALLAGIAAAAPAQPEGENHDRR